MPTKDQVRRLSELGLDYPEIGQRLGVSAGLAYLIATGTPADGGSVPSARQRTQPQELANPAAENPTHRQTVQRWIVERVRLDGQLRAAD